MKVQATLMSTQLLCLESEMQSLFVAGMYRGSQVKSKPSAQPYFKSIVETLGSVNRPGCYATSGVKKMPQPSVCLDCSPDDMILELPLAECQVRGRCAEYCVLNKDEMVIGHRGRQQPIELSEFF